VKPGDEVEVRLSPPRGDWPERYWRSGKLLRRCTVYRAAWWVVVRGHAYIVPKANIRPPRPAAGQPRRAPTKYRDYGPCKGCGTKRWRYDAVAETTVCAGCGQYACLQRTG
jgi:hypothetical protein